MKDAQHHLKNVQKKVLRETKKSPKEALSTTKPLIIEFTRPKILQNRRKSAKLA